MKLSVLIPAYNAERTIENCLKALLRQSNQNFELIICDDGSKDSTCAIITSFLPQFKNAKLLKQKNKGVGITRTRLVNEASGEYIIFCDSDDYFNENTVENVLYIIEQQSADLYVWGYSLVKSYGRRRIVHRRLAEGVHTKEEWGGLHCAGLGDLYFSSLCNKCYKKSLIMQPAPIEFHPVIEDVIFNVEYMQRCKTVHIRFSADYNYVQIGKSLTRNCNKTTRESAIAAMTAYLYLNEALKSTYPDQTKKRVEFLYLKLSSLINAVKNIKETEVENEIIDSELWKEIMENLGTGRIRCGVVKLNNDIKQMIKRILVNLGR